MYLNEICYYKPELLANNKKFMFHCNGALLVFIVGLFCQQIIRLMGLNLKLPKGMRIEDMSAKFYPIKNKLFGDINLVFLQSLFHSTTLIFDILTWCRSKYQNIPQAVLN